MLRGAAWLLLCAAASPKLAHAYLQSDNWVVQEYVPGVVPIHSGQLYEPMVNPFRWTWYAIPLLSIDEDNATVYHNLLVEIDAVDMHTLPGSGGALHWAAFDVMVVNESLPANAQTEELGPVETGAPTCWFNEVCPGGYYARYSKAARVTTSFGYNATSPGGQVSVRVGTHTIACARTLQCIAHCTCNALRTAMRAACAPQVNPMRTVYIGIREAGLSGGFVRYKFRATALPRVIKDGMVIPTSLPACVTSIDSIGTEELDFCRQYYVVDIGPFDVFSATLTRGGRTVQGSNLTMLSPDGLQEQSTGEGFVGSLTLSDPEHYMDPTMAYTSPKHQQVDFSNRTARGAVGVYCTLELHQAPCTARTMHQRTNECTHECTHVCTRECSVTNAPMHLAPMHHAPMPQCPNAPMARCANAPMPQFANDPMRRGCTLSPSSPTTRSPEVSGRRSGSRARGAAALT